MAVSPSLERHPANATFATGSHALHAVVDGAPTRRAVLPRRSQVVHTLRQPPENCCCMRSHHQRRDRKILQTHVPHIELRHADEFTHPDIPRGGCWERLCAISHYTKGNYVVQLDADTLTIGSIDNVVNAIANKAGFVLGEEPSQCLLSLAQVSANGPTEH